MHLAPILAVAALLAVVGCGKSLEPAQAADSLAIDPPGLAMRMGQVFHLLAVVTRGSDTLPAPNVRWSSEDATVATIDSTGRLVGVGCCRTNIIARLAALRATLDLIVVEPACGSFVISPAAVTLHVGEQAQATAFLNCGAVRPTLLWRSSAPGVVAVSDSGVLTARATGRAAIFAKVTHDTTVYAALAATVVP